MAELSTARFLAFLALLSAFFLLKLFPDNDSNSLVDIAASICSLAALIVGIPSHELHRRLSWNPRRFLAGLLWLLLVLLVLFALREHLEKPALIVTTWVVSVVGFCWQRSRKPRLATNGMKDGQ